MSKDDSNPYASPQHDLINRGNLRRSNRWQNWGIGGYLVIHAIQIVVGSFAGQHEGYLYSTPAIVHQLAMLCASLPCIFFFGGLALLSFSSFRRSNTLFAIAVLDLIGTFVNFCLTIPLFQ